MLSFRFLIMRRRYCVENRTYVGEPLALVGNYLATVILSVGWSAIEMCIGAAEEPDWLNISLGYSTKN